MLNFLKKLAHAYLVRQYFLSLLAGKFRPFEQSAGVTAFMEIFKRSKTSGHIKTANIKPAHVQKA